MFTRKGISDTEVEKSKSRIQIFAELIKKFISSKDIKEEDRKEIFKNN